MNSIAKGPGPEMEGCWLLVGPMLQVGDRKPEERWDLQMGAVLSGRKTLRTWPLLGSYPSRLTGDGFPKV